MEKCLLKRDWDWNLSTLEKIIKKKTSAKKTCKLAGAISSRKERLAKSEMNASLQKHSSLGVL